MPKPSAWMYSGLHSCREQHQGGALKCALLLLISQQSHPLNTVVLLTPCKHVSALRARLADHERRRAPRGRHSSWPRRGRGCRKQSKRRPGARSGWRMPRRGPRRALHQLSGCDKKLPLHGCEAPVPAVPQPLRCGWVAAAASQHPRRLSGRRLRRDKPAALWGRVCMAHAFQYFGMQEAQQLAEAGAAAARQELAQYALESVAGVSPPLAVPAGRTASRHLCNGMSKLHGVCWRANAAEPLVAVQLPTDTLHNMLSAHGAHAVPACLLQISNIQSPCLNVPLQVASPEQRRPGQDVTLPEALSARQPHSSGSASSAISASFNAAVRSRVALEKGALLLLYEQAPKKGQSLRICCPVIACCWRKRCWVLWRSVAAQQSGSHVHGAETPDVWSCGIVTGVWRPQQARHKLRPRGGAVRRRGGPVRRGEYSRSNRLQDVAIAAVQHTHAGLSRRDPVADSPANPHSRTSASLCPRPSSVGAFRYRAGRRGCCPATSAAWGRWRRCGAPRPAPMPPCWQSTAPQRQQVWGVSAYVRLPEHTEPSGAKPHVQPRLL